MLRSLLAAVLVLALVPATALANTSVWASRAVFDEATFTETLTRALDTPEAESALAARLARALFDALVEADDRAPLVLGPLVGGALGAGDTAIVDGLERRIRVALDDPLMEAARNELVNDIHAAFLGITGDNGVVRIDGDTIVVDARGLLEAILVALDPLLGPLGLRVPAGTPREVELAASPGLGATSQGLSALERLGVILPLLAVALGLLAAVVAHRRSRALAIVGVAIALGGVAGLGLVALGGVAVGRAAPALEPALVSATYDALSADLAVQSTMLIGGGAALAVVAGLAGLLPRRRSRRTPGATEPW